MEETWADCVYYEDGVVAGVCYGVDRLCGLISKSDYRRMYEDVQILISVGEFRPIPTIARPSVEEIYTSV